ncbi:Copper transport protein CTR4 [Colletotrichum orbiculare MAFF 240422]|uniref:Copper transport protein n=1 Tax=Colletotrichum orbiculare (strain 104-T / ATCC 96160 / CBS 514.97 / LARS 414 / MAFF 240422) TaxID=1213857 RepID=N4VN52_COLOR|nr:Copper transport protein CTR4 [Colletotrichum orbiculare MAFF 240422]
MDHGSAAMADCKVSMLWNWDTVDACFLSSSWQIRNGGMMAASCIGVVLLVVLLEVLRAMTKKFDDMMLAQMRRRAESLLANSTTTTADASLSPAPIVMRVSPLQQVLRCLLYAVTFGLAYVIMLLAMYFNGYIIISIIVGAGLGKFVTDWLTYTAHVGEGGALPAKKTTGIEEPTVCCQ